MISFGKQKTTEEVINEVTGRLTEDIANLTDDRDNALSAFRRTAENLKNVNEQLQTKVTNLAELQAFITGQQTNAQKMIADNAAVRDKILDIIGG